MTFLASPQPQVQLENHVEAAESQILPRCGAASTTPGIDAADPHCFEAVGGMRVVQSLHVEFKEKHR